MATQTLRPNGTADGTPIAVVPSGTAHGVTSDNNDSTYFTSYFLTNTVLLSMEDFSLPAGAVTKQGRLRHRGRADSGTISLGCARWIPETGPDAWEIPMITAGGAGTTITTRNGAYGAITWDQATINALQIYCGGGGTQRNYEVYFDLVYVAKPVVTVTAVSPDPYDVSNVIPISWVNTLDSDGGAQTHFRVWVTDDDNSNAIAYDSGIVASAATTHNAGPLPNGNYTVHVTTAQTVNGNQHWSDEDTDSFDLDVDAVEIDTVTVAPNDAIGGNVVTIARDTGSEAWERVSLERSEDNGATWEPVWDATWAVPDGSGSHEVTDYLAPPVSVIYRARGAHQLNEVWVIGPWATSSTAKWETEQVWVKVPGAPGLNRTFRMAKQPPTTRDVTRGVFPILGSPYKVVVSDARQAPSGTLTFRLQNDQDFEDLDGLVEWPVLLIHAPESWGHRWKRIRYISPGAESDEPPPKALMRTGSVSIPFDSVAPPNDPNAGTLD